MLDQVALELRRRVEGLAAELALVVQAFLCGKTGDKKQRRQNAVRREFPFALTAPVSPGDAVTRARVCRPPPEHSERRLSPHLNSKKKI